MADTKNFENLINLEGLTEYDKKIKEHIGTELNGEKVTINSDTTTPGAAKSYTVKQGEDTIGVIDIPKDMVVSEARVVENPSDKPQGTYIEMTIANNDGTKLYIDVSKLVDNYTAVTEATQVKLTINAATRTISAALVAGGVTTDIIAAGAVTKDKLASNIQASLDNADSAIQEIDTGSEDGTISVDGEDVEVKGFSQLKDKVDDLGGQDIPEITIASTAQIDALFD